MGNREPRIKQRILIKMVHDLKMEPEEIVRVMAAFDDLVILTKKTSDEMLLNNKRIFELDKEKYKNKMNWINEYTNLKGLEEKVFTNLNNFEISSDDYDYYYSRKTETEYKKEEEARKAKKLEAKDNKIEKEINE